MKIIRIIIIYLVLLSPLMGQQANLQSGLYIATDLRGNFYPYIHGGGSIILFYRFISDVFPGYIWEGIKTDVGIYDYISAEKNNFTLFVSSSISKYFDIDTKVAFNSYYTSAKRGLIVFDDKNASYNFDGIEKAHKESAFGFEVAIKPTLRYEFFENLFDGRGIILQVATTIKYAFANTDSEYYLDYDLLLLREFSDFSYEFDSLLLFNLSPMSVGVNYMLGYVQNTKNIWHKLGIYANLRYDFFNRLYLDVNGKIGQYLYHTMYPGTLYFDVNTMISFKIL